MRRYPHLIIALLPLYHYQLCWVFRYANSIVRMHWHNIFRCIL